MQGGIAGNAAEQQLGISLNWSALSQERGERRGPATQNLLPPPLRAPSPWSGQGALQSWKVPCRE